MRLLLLPAVALIFPVQLVAQEPVPAQRPLLADPGHAFPDDERQITVELRAATATAAMLQQFQDGAQRSITAITPQLQLTEVSDDKVSENGIQLVSARTVREYPQTTWIRLLNDADVKQLLERLQQDERTNILMAPKVTIFNRQTANISDVVTRPKAPATATSTDEDTDIVENGFNFLVRCRVLPENGVRVDCRTRFAESNSAATSPVHKTTLELSANIPEGQTLAVWGMRDVHGGVPRVLRGRSSLGRLFKGDQRVFAEPRIMVLLLTPRIIDAAE